MKRGPAGNETFRKACLVVQKRLAEGFAALDVNRSVWSARDALFIQAELARDHRTMSELREWWCEGPPVD